MRLVSQSLSNQYLSDPDVQLMLKVAGGDHSAFEQLVERYQDRMVGFFFHIVRDRSAAEDLAQDVFLRVYRSRERYEARARFSTWLFRIAHNLANNQRRDTIRKREIPIAPGSDAYDFQPQGKILAEKSALLPTRRLDSLEMRDIVRNALDDLGERQKTAVLLHKFEGMSYEEIGEVMGLGTVAVKSLLARARLRLKEVLEKYL
ncbi:MAG: RNA polymerase sigma factor [Planctomyces sp.]